jgi:hypothetical protein
MMLNAITVRTILIDDAFLTNGALLKVLLCTLALQFTVL